MTRAEVLQMEAGNSLNKLIALNVMGWKRDNSWVDERGRAHWSVRLWSQEIKDAWDVVEKLQENQQELLSLHYGTLRTSERLEWEATWRRSGVFAYGDTAPLAICRASLLCVEIRRVG